MKIRCGIYDILMVPLTLLDIPLTVLTPSNVHAYRAILAWQVLHPELNVPIAELLTYDIPHLTPGPPSNSSPSSPFHVVQSRWYTPIPWMQRRKESLRLRNRWQSNRSTKDLPWPSASTVLRDDYDHVGPLRRLTSRPFLVCSGLIFLLIILHHCIRMRVPQRYQTQDGVFSWENSSVLAIQKMMDIL